MENQTLQRQENQHQSDTPELGAVQAKLAGQSLAPPAFQLKTSEAPIQARFVGTHGWLNSISDEQLDGLQEDQADGKVGATTFDIWKTLRDRGFEIPIETGQPSFNFSNLTLSLPQEWTDSLKAYFKDGTKDAHLGRALAGFTHELSHAHDRLIEKDSPKGKSESDDSKCIAVLRTELKAWWKEAKSAREASRLDSKVPSGAENNTLIASWLAVKYLIADGKDPLKADIYDNTVIGRLHLYFNKNKSTETSTTLSQLITDESTGLGAQLFEYANDIRNMFASDDSKLRQVAASAMKTSD